jgi:hypothetical protein
MLSLHDPVGRVLLVKVKGDSYPGMLWRRGHAKMLQADGRPD